MAGYKIEFKGERIEPRGKFGYINPNDIESTDDPYKVIANKEIFYNGNKLYKINDTINVYPENIYYEIQLTSNSGKVHTLYPRIQDNPTMGMAASPDIKRDLTRKNLRFH